MPVCRYYHATGSRLPVGQEVVARSARTGDPFEQLAERYRPASSPSRLGAFFLTDDPAHNEVLGALNHRYYEVEPVGDAARVDYRWLAYAKELFLYGDKSAAERRDIIEMIRGYWSGKKSEHFQAWEWVAKRIYVCRQLSETERARAMKAGEKRYGFSVLTERMIREVMVKDPRTRSKMDLEPDAPPAKAATRPTRTVARKTARAPAGERSAKRSVTSDFERQLRRLQGTEPPSSPRGSRKRRRS